MGIIQCDRDGMSSLLRAANKGIKRSVHTKKVRKHRALKAKDPGRHLHQYDHDSADACWTTR